METIRISKHHSMALLLCLAATSLVASGCKTRSLSDTKHNIGEVTTRESPFTCKKTAPPEELAVLHAYVSDLMKHISEKGKDVIPQKYAEGFCLTVNNDADINAYASAAGDIIINGGLVMTLRNDAQLASVVAHEMAHALNAHGRPESFPAEMREDEQFMALIKKLKESSAALDELDAVFKKQEDASPSDDHKADLSAYTRILSATIGAVFKDPNINPRIDLYNRVTQSKMDPSFKGTSKQFTLRDSWPLGSLIGMLQDLRTTYLTEKSQDFKVKFLEQEKIILQAVEKGMVLLEKTSEMQRRVFQLHLSKMGETRATNWREQDADEIGFELYIRAGFAREEFTKMLAVLQEKVLAAILDGQGVDTPRTQQIEAPVSLADEIRGASCKRGLSSHPRPCWRIENIKNEWEKHKEFYTKISPAQPVVDLFGSRLLVVKRDLKLHKIPRGEAQQGPTDGNTGNDSSSEPSKDTTWCDPYRPSVCHRYCSSLSSDPDMDGWGYENGKTCVIRNGPVTQRE